MTRLLTILAALLCASPVLAQSFNEPCATSPKVNVAVSQTANSTLIAGTAGQRLYICSLFLINTTAQTFSLVEGTGTNCGTGTAAILGGATAATGPAHGATAGFPLGNGAGTIAQTAVAGDGVCLLQSAATLIAGNLTYVRR